jgi:sugar/nucleoside kinase (ribokinase family)
LIYRQKKGEVLPDEFLGVRRSSGDNAMIIVSREWIAEARRALEKRGVAVHTNFGGLANATASILAALTAKGKIILIAPCGNDQPGRDNAAYLERLGVDTGVLRKIMRTTRVSASNLIRNLEVARGGKDKSVIHCKDYALCLGSVEGFPYSKWMPGDLGRQDIVHLGGVDQALYCGRLSKKQKLEKYRKNIADLSGLAQRARQKGALVVGDFCAGDPDFWEVVPDSFFKDIHVVKPSIAQALAIYNSRHRNHPVKLDVSDPLRLAREQRKALFRIQDFLLELGFLAVFMTLDAGGTIISARKGSVYGKVGARHVPALPPRKFVDGTGCGDAFVAGIIYCLRQEKDMFTTACFASTIGSLIAERVGVILEERYRGRGKWLAVVEKRLKKSLGIFASRI